MAFLSVEYPLQTTSLKFLAYQFLIVFFLCSLIGCNLANESKKLHITPNESIELENNYTFKTIDTVLKDGKYLSIEVNASKGSKETVSAYWGNSDNDYKLEFSEENEIWIRGYLSGALKWTSKNCFGLVDGCGTNCMYSIILNSRTGESKQIPTNFYPGNYRNDRKDLILYPGAKDNYPSIVIENIETQEKDTMKIPDNWIRGVGLLENIIDSITINNGVVEVFQFNETKTQRIVKKI